MLDQYGWKVNRAQLMMSPGDPMCQLAVIGRQGAEEAMVYSATVLIISVRILMLAPDAIACSGCDHPRGKEYRCHTIPKMLMTDIEKKTGREEGRPPT